MRNMKKAVALVLCVILTVSVLSISALAADANVTYSGSAGKFIFAPGSDYSLTDLFPNFKDVMPGDTLTQTITVRNDEKNGVKVRIYLRSLGASDEKYADFLHQMHLTVEKVGNSPMFDAQADEKDGLTEWTYLGTLYSGGEVDLNVTLEVPTSMDDRFQSDYGEVLWEFAVEELPIEPEDPDPRHKDERDSGEEWFAPLTGGEPAVKIWAALLGISAVGMIVFSRDKRQKDKERVER